MQDVLSTVGDEVMLDYVKQDITTITHGVVAHGVNCQGVMGAGVALAIRNKWPKAYSHYTELCKTVIPPIRTNSLLGLCQFVNITNTATVQLVVVNCFTQDMFGSDGKKYVSKRALRTALDRVMEVCVQMDLPLYLPKIGSLRGGLSWENEVEPLVSELQQKHQCKVTICEI